MRYAPSTSAEIHNRPRADDDTDFEPFLAGMRAYFKRYSGGPLFTTDAGTGPVSLFNMFVAALPRRRRQHYTCNCCRRFIDRFGGLVTITPDGETVPVMWDPEAPGMFQKVSVALAGFVSRADVTGVFVASELDWGTPEAGGWHHLSVQSPCVFRDPLRTAGQQMAVHHEEYGMLTRALLDFPMPLVEQAHELLSADALYRSEKFVGVTQWLMDLHKSTRGLVVGTRARDNLLWLAVAQAPVGFCHVRGTMVGSLLGDLRDATLTTEAVRKRFNEKMHPLKYQRPTAPPKAGNIERAEKVVAALDSEGALRRRYARLADIPAHGRLWMPRSAPTMRHVPGVFSHLRTQHRADTRAALHEQDITWHKFQRDVLPTAREMQCLVPSYVRAYTLVTAENPAAAPIVQWDSEDARNPVTWFTIHGSQPALSSWHLRPDALADVETVCTFPHQWSGPDFKHHGDGVLFVLKDAKPPYGGGGGGGLFPEHLKAAYHEVRSTIEAHMKRTPLSGHAFASAAGFGLRASGTAMPIVVQVTSSAGKARYRIDRWE